MTNPLPKNFAASVSARLKNISQKTNTDFAYLLLRYATERFLFRLSVSSFAERFVLKGANLFTVWQMDSFRSTRDSDLWCCGNADQKHLKDIFCILCTSNAIPDDGMRFDDASVAVSSIREEQQYGGTRVTFNGFLGNARIPLQFDIGFGDVITPAAELAEYPVLLDGEVPRIKIYPRYTVISEKTEAMVSLGQGNSRMKDFYDVWLLSEMFDYKFSVLRQAVANTFARRQTSIPVEIPLAFTEIFYLNANKRTQWNAFCKKNKLSNAPTDLAAVITRISSLMIPVFENALNGNIEWKAAIGWQLPE